MDKKAIKRLEATSAMTVGTAVRIQRPLFDMHFLLPFLKLRFLLARSASEDSDLDNFLLCAVPHCEVPFYFLLLFDLGLT